MTCRSCVVSRGAPEALRPEQRRVGWRTGQSRGHAASSVGRQEAPGTQSHQVSDGDRRLLFFLPTPLSRFQRQRAHPRAVPAEGASQRTAAQKVIPTCHQWQWFLALSLNPSDCLCLETTTMFFAFCEAVSFPTSQIAFYHATLGKETFICANCLSNTE